MAATTETLVINDRQPSERLTLAIKECASGFRRLRDNINTAIEIGLEEGFSTKQVSTLIRSELSENTSMSDRQVRRYLPSQLKDQSKVRSNLRTELTAKPKTELDFSTLTEQDLYKMKKQELIDIIVNRLLLQQTKHEQQQKQAITHVVKQIKTGIERKPKLVIPVGKSPFSRIPVNKTPDSKSKEVLELHAQKKSSREIMRLTGVSKSAILRIIKQSD